MEKGINLKEHFPVFKRQINGHPLIYLDSAATTLKPYPVIQSYVDFNEQLGSTVHRGVYTLVREASALYEEARQKIAGFIGAKFEEVVFTKGTTHSLNILARTFVKTFCKPGDKILITEIEHHANVVPWQMMAKEYGIIVDYLLVDDKGQLIIPDYLDPKTKLISVAHISNVLGTIHPISLLVEKAREIGAFVCLDAAQSVAHQHLDVKNLDVDFAVFSAHKMYGPTGLGILYGKREYLELLEAVEGGGDMIQMVSKESFTTNSLPYKFEPGTPPIAEVIGLAAAIDFMEEIGLQKISEHEQALTQHTHHLLKDMPEIECIGMPMHRGPIISFNLKNWHPLDVITMLDCKGIALRTGHHCSQLSMQRFGRESTLRASFGLYNTQEDVDSFILAIKKLVAGP